MWSSPSPPPSQSTARPLVPASSTTATTLYFTTPEPTAVLTEGYYTTLPNVAYQVQVYSFSS